MKNRVKSRKYEMYIAMPQRLTSSIIRQLVRFTYEYAVTTKPMIIWTICEVVISIANGFGTRIPAALRA